MSDAALHRNGTRLALVPITQGGPASAGFNLEKTEVGLRLAWDEADHPRWPAGDERGGEFRSLKDYVEANAPIRSSHNAGVMKRMIEEHGTDPFLETEFFGGPASFQINDYMRSRAYGEPAPLEDYIVPHVDAIEKYVGEFRIEEDKVAYRGMNGNALDQIGLPGFSDIGLPKDQPMPDNWVELWSEHVKGIRFIDAGFPFVSTNPKIARMYANPGAGSHLNSSNYSDRAGAIFRVHLKAGDPGLDEPKVYGFNAESEVVLPTNRMFTVTGVSRSEDGEIAVDVEVSDGSGDPDYAEYVKILSLKKIIHDLSLEIDRLDSRMIRDHEWELIDRLDELKNKRNRMQSELDSARAHSHLQLADVRTDMAPGGNPYHDKGGRFTTRIKAVPKKIRVDWLVEHLPGATDTQLDEIWKALPQTSENRRSLVRDEKVRRMRAQSGDAKLESFREKAPKDGALIRDRLDFMLGTKSAQSGGVVVDDGQYSHYAGKYDYASNSAHVSTVTMDRPEEYWNALIHEQLHGHSAGSHSKINLYKILDNPELEEGVVEGATRAFRPRILEHMRTQDPNTFASPIPDDAHFDAMDKTHPYNAYVEPLDAKADEMGIPRDEFYRKLIALPVDKRAEFLKMPLKGEGSGKTDSKRVVQEASPKGHKIGDKVTIDGVDYTYDGMEHTGKDAWVKPEGGGKRKRVPLESLPEATGAPQETPKPDPKVDKPPSSSPKLVAPTGKQALDFRGTQDSGRIVPLVPVDGKPDAGAGKAEPSAPAQAIPAPAPVKKKINFAETFDMAPPDEEWKTSLDTPTFAGYGKDKLPARQILEGAGFNVDKPPARQAWKIKLDAPKVPASNRPSSWNKDKKPEDVAEWAKFDVDYRAWLESLSDAEFISYVGTYGQMDRYGDDVFAQVAKKRAGIDPELVLPEGISEAFTAMGSNPLKLREELKTAGQMPGGYVNSVWYKAAQNPNGENTAAGRLVQMAQAKGVTPEELAQDLTDRVREALSTAKVASRVSAGTLDKVLKGGRFKTQFETSKSGGRFDRELRAEHEQFLFGYSPTLPPEQRPFYGYLTGDDEIPYDPESDLSQYGDVIVYFNDESRKRTSVTGDDSLPYSNADVVPQPIDDADWRMSFRSQWGAHSFVDQMKANTFNKGDGGGMKGWMSYAEAQIHGGTTIDDISHVVLPYPNPKLEAQLKKKGIAFEVRGAPSDAFVHDATRMVALFKDKDTEHDKKNLAAAQAKIDAVRELEKRGELPVWPDVWSASGEQLREIYIKSEMADLYSPDQALARVWGVLQEHAHGESAKRWRESEGEGYTWISPDNVRKTKGDKMVATLRKMYPELKSEWPWLPPLEEIISSFYAKRGFRK